MENKLFDLVYWFIAMIVILWVAFGLFDGWATVGILIGYIIGVIFMLIIVFILNGGQKS